VEKVVSERHFIYPLEQVDELEDEEELEEDVDVTATLPLVEVVVDGTIGVPDVDEEVLEGMTAPLDELVDEEDDEVDPTTLEEVDEVDEVEDVDEVDATIPVTKFS